MTETLKEKIEMLMILADVAAKEYSRLQTECENVASRYLEVLNQGVEFLDHETNKLLRQFYKAAND